MDAQGKLPSNGLIAVDWGTSRLRAKYVGPDGRPLAELESAEGIGQLSDGHEAVFERLVEDWPRAPAIMAGMVGSRQGWREADYVACPTTVDALAGHMVRFKTSRGRPVLIVPGLTARTDDGQPDVIRGEETQIIGLMGEQAEFTGTCILPGTHSKWVTVAENVITGFQTFLTGELFSLLARTSFLRHSVEEDGRDIAAVPDFSEAVRRVAQDGVPFLSTIFSVRARRLLDDVAPGDNLAYLSGLIIGGEIAAAGALGLFDEGPLTIVGGRSLARAYARALAVLNHPTEIHDGDAMVLAGLLRLARVTGLLEESAT